jgi:hypothetical protein
LHLDAKKFEYYPPTTSSLAQLGNCFKALLAVVKNRINLATINGGVNWRRNLAMICGVGFWRLIVVNAEPQIDRAP